MDRLLFPVKLGPEIADVLRKFGTSRLGATARDRWGKVAGLLPLLLLPAVGCGYRAAYGTTSDRYDVVAGEYSTASFEAVQEAVAGVRSELGAARALGPGYPRVVVEILRVDERSIGVRRATADLPLARGSEITVLGRAFVVRSVGGAPGLDTGDLSRSAQYASGTTPTADAAARGRAVRDAARSLGKALGRAILGLPEPLEG